MRRRGDAVIVAVVAFLLVAAPAIGAPRDNPFVGSWESFVYNEDDTLSDGFSCWWRTGRGDPSDCD